MSCPTSEKMRRVYSQKNPVVQINISEMQILGKKVFRIERKIES